MLFLVSSDRLWAINQHSIKVRLSHWRNTLPLRHRILERWSATESSDAGQKEVKGMNRSLCRSEGKDRVDLQ